MKKTLVTLLAGLALCSSPVFAQDQEQNESPWEISANANLSSGYLWAGYIYGGLSIVPAVEVDYSLTEDFYLFGSAMTILDTRISLPLSDGGAYDCQTVSAGFGYKDFCAYIDAENYNWTFNDKSAFYIGAGFDYTVSEDFPLSVSWYTVLYNKGTSDWANGLYGEIKPNGKQSHSTLISASYPFICKDNFELGVEAAFVPWASPFCGYENPSICQLGIDGTYNFKIADTDLPLNFKVGWNPAGNIAYYQLNLIYSF